MFVLMPVEDVDLPIFKRDMQEAFQIGAEAECGKTDDQIGRASCRERVS